MLIQSKIQRDREISRRKEILPKIAEILTQQLDNWCGDRFERYLGYREELKNIRKNASLYDGAFSLVEEQRDLSYIKKVYEDEKVIILNSINNLEADLKLYKADYNQLFGKFIDEPFTEEERRLYSKIDNVTSQLPSLKSQYRTCLLILKDIANATHQSSKTE